MSTFAVSPDGARYLQMATAIGAPMPFHLRWLLPTILRGNIRAWQIASYTGWVLLVLGIGYVGGWTAALLVAVLPGPAFGFKRVVLVDAVAMGIAAWCMAFDPMWAQVLLGLILGCISERAPIFAALWAWSPWPLVGLIAPMLRYMLYRPGPEHPALVGKPAADVIIKPWRIGLTRNWHDMALIVPWGGLLASFCWLDVQMALTLFVAYSQLFVATDTVRLYQWAAPVLAITIATHLDWRACLILALLTWFNPWRGEGY